MERGLQIWRKFPIRIEIIRFRKCQLRKKKNAISSTHAQLTNHTQTRILSKKRFSKFIFAVWHYTMPINPLSFCNFTHTFQLKNFIYFKGAISTTVLPHFTSHFIMLITNLLLISKWWTMSKTVVDCTSSFRVLS